jgi:hypothetical protein
MLKLAQFAMKILISMTFMLHFVATLTTLGVYWSTLLLQESVKLPNVRRSFMNWCSSFGLSTTMAEVIKVEDPRDDGSPQLTPTTSSQNI